MKHLVWIKYADGSGIGFGTDVECPDVYIDDLIELRKVNDVEQIKKMLAGEKIDNSQDYRVGDSGRQ
jgi:hypothetical protein